MSQIVNYLLQKFYAREFELITDFYDTHAIFKLPVSTLLKMDIINWKHNRPPDMIRCFEIANYYQSIAPNIFMDCILHLHLNTTTNQFEVIDGIHRITALLELHKRFSMDPDPQHKYYWFYNTIIFVSIRKDKSDIVLADLFHNLNKTVPVSSLYIEPIQEMQQGSGFAPMYREADSDEETESDIESNSDEETVALEEIVEEDTKSDSGSESDSVSEHEPVLLTCRGIIEKITNEWQNKYKLHFSPNGRCHRPNINRDRFQDILLEMWNILIQIYELHEMEVKMNEMLEEINTFSKSTYENINTPTKVKKSGKYIFMFDKNTIIYWTRCFSNRY